MNKSGIHMVSPSVWQSQGLYFSYQQYQIFYQTAGVGEPLVLIHGFPTSSWDWYKVWHPLSERYRVIAFDMIGFGFSDKPRRYAYSIHDQADIFEALLRHLGLNYCHLLAHDYGDTVAQELLARHEDRLEHPNAIDIRSVCFLNGGLFPEMHRALLVQKILKSPFGVFLSQLNSKKRLRRSFNQLYGPPGIDEKELTGFWDILCYQDGHRLPHKLIHYIDDRRRHRERWVGALQQTSVPLRLINGPEDPVSGRHLTVYYEKMLPHPDVVLIEGTGHYPQNEAPEALLAYYSAFRARHFGD
jgi:pimeloyl-ACP methyl ester carboxylesterase